MGIALVTLIVFTLAYGVSIGGNAVFLPAFLLLAVLTAAGVGVFFAALNVKYRDITAVMPLFVQIWLFITPVVYPGSLVTGSLKYLYALNPMVSALNGVRWSLLGATAPAAGEVAVSVAGALVILAVAGIYFRRSEGFFADVI
jgi:lipopolysaccharide transport system permease protein